MIGLDIETTALDPGEGKIRSVQLSDGKRARVYDLFAQNSNHVRNAILAEDDLVAHNAVFEHAWLQRHMRINPELADTMIMSQVYYTGTKAAMRNGFSHSLTNVVKRELKAELPKEEQASDWEAMPLSRDQITYAARDAAVLPGLADRLLAKIERAGLRKVYELERRVSYAVDAMQRRGVAIHTDRLDAMIEEATERAERLKAELTEEWGINPGSSKQLREHFNLDAREDWPKTPAGAASTNQDAMKALVADYPEVEKWVEWKEVEKIRSTYGESLRKRLSETNRIHARFNPFGTATGRFSSSGPNLQNIPKRGAFGKRMRGLFWSGSDDRILIKADYVSIELWVAAIVWNDPSMQYALQRGVNMHVATAASLFGVKPEEVTKKQKATGKIVNFALLYGGSPNRILEEFKKNGIAIDEEGARETHAKFFLTYTGFNRRRLAWRDAYRQAEEENDTVVARTEIGRRRTFAEWHGPLLNHEVQGTAADGIKFAIARLHEDPMPDVYPVLTVHDEIVVEAPASRQEEVAAWIEHHMVQGMLEGVQRGEADVPSLPEVEVEIGREWS